MSHEMSDETDIEMAALPSNQPETTNLITAVATIAETNNIIRNIFMSVFAPICILLVVVVCTAIMIGVGIFTCWIFNLPIDLRDWREYFLFTFVGSSVIFGIIKFIKELCKI